jgi:hypothetical protein
MVAKTNPVSLLCTGFGPAPEFLRVINVLVDNELLSKLSWHESSRDGENEFMEGVRLFSLLHS